MSVRNTIILNHSDLKYLLIDSLRLYSDNVVFIDGNIGILAKTDILTSHKKLDIQYEEKKTFYLPL